MIVTHDLSKHFDDFQAVDGVSLEVEAGQVLALLGPNGAGKTTTIRMLTSILKPSRGYAQVAGYDVVSQPDKVRAMVGVLTEQHGLYGRMRGGEYLDFFGQIYHLPAGIRKARIEQLLSTFGLTDSLRKPIAEYSKGMRQKLALARALLHEPPVLLLDEPTSAMDPESAHQVRSSIQELRSADRTIIISTHNLSEAEELADKVAIIRRGRIIARGSPSQLKEQLLGPSEYEVRLVGELNGRQPHLPDAAQLTGCGSGWIRFKTDQPQQTNPTVLRQLLEQGFEVFGLYEITRSLEQVYLQAISQPDNGEIYVG